MTTHKNSLKASKPLLPNTPSTEPENPWFFIHVHAEGATTHCRFKVGKIGQMTGNGIESMLTASLCEGPEGADIIVSLMSAPGEPIALRTDCFKIEGSLIEGWSRTDSPLQLSAHSKQCIINAIKESYTKNVGDEPSAGFKMSVLAVQLTGRFNMC